MNDQGLKNKIIEWMKLRDEVENLTKAIHEDIVAGIKVPHELKSHSDVIPREHPHRELAANFVHQVNRKDRAEGARMSAKYLGIGHDGHPIKKPITSTNYANITNKAEAIPADVSAPVIQNRVDTNGPKMIEQPNIINPYKEIFSALKRKR
jgi:hypothetical protein